MRQNSTMPREQISTKPSLVEWLMTITNAIHILKPLTDYKCTLWGQFYLFFINANSLFFMTWWNSDFGLTELPEISLNHGYGIICKTKLPKDMVKFVDLTFKYHLTSKYVSEDRNKKIRRI